MSHSIAFFSTRSRGRALHGRAEHHVLLHREPGEERVALEHHAAIGAGTEHRLPVELHLAARRVVEPRQDADQRGLAAPRGADDADELAPMHLEVDAIERGHARVVFAELAGQELDAHHHLTLAKLAEILRDVGRLFEVAR